ncbi:TetR/AcrR family transcriptional regulator [Cellulomonas fimi]|uniref:Regulatory protein TetR n=1 Tax=Cellulomonas fimi (strain ATCC 484 / DSM 20113 / JCM 1341 / CCUG 24087 / LMG 16345 / NBRC 15513 / NCIMB 8980 / NCTC 7547 / NRS-133) TaxID=590998 RepID=F4H701_CELFA|nr:TetR/AcrR family transcriptional regulator [Cellulomonas fimi]AEE44510.1 regulatory protein TetR [Cellulomonas fimi ATCC 484]NNH06514.1 TetR/AcrR family transcriptional regulator [Cellulomonas fimi]VEH26505.1 mycofactocin system transcriptional regulator [Cellulomonas fimi]
MIDRTGGRRAALRERHHRAILDAAAALLDETGGTAFTVDELAARADVSRRTVFNHFESLDDVVTTVCGEILGTVFDSLEQHSAAADPDATMFDELAHALTTTDLVTPMAYLTRLLGGATPDALTPRREAMVGRALTEVSARLSTELLRRHPDADPFDVQLLVGSLMSGVLVIHPYWHRATGAVDDAASRAVWDALLGRLLASARAGYGAAGPLPTNPPVPTADAPLPVFSVAPTCGTEPVPSAASTRTP